MQSPGFWDDQEAAATVSAKHARTQRRLQSYKELESDVGDLSDLVEMAEDDPEIAGELDSQLSGIERKLAALEEARLFRGEYDSGDAVVTVRSGAGGTDSQDWAEMLLRMYLRWVERRGFSAEMNEASEGDEAGLKSATFTVHGENAYGLFGAERGVHRLVRISPFDAQSRRHTAFAEVDVAPLVGDAVAGRDRRERPSDRHLPGLGRRRAARQQDRFGRADHPRADGHRRPVPERALAAPEQGDRDALPAREADRARGAKALRGAGGGSRRSPGRRLGLADPQLHAASRRSGSRITGRASR